MPKVRALGFVVSLLTVAAVLPAAAQAHDSYVDQGTGSDASNDCSAKATPCKNIVYALTQTGSGDTVFVAGGYTYTGHFDLFDGQSLVHENFGDAHGPAILDAGTNPSGTIYVNSSNFDGFTHIEGFNLRSQVEALSCATSCKVEDNTFDEPDQLADPQDAELALRGDNSTHIVRRNTFVDSTPALDASGEQEAVSAVNDPKSVEISDNTFTGFQISLSMSISIKGTIEDNEIIGTHPAGNRIGYGILGGSSGLMIERNRLVRPKDNGEAFDTVGIAPSRGSTISRNLISGYEQGFELNNEEGVVHLDNDVIRGSGDPVSVGINMNDDLADDPHVSDVKATNLTILDTPAGAARMNQAHLDLDSSIVEDSIGTTDSSCSISYSRGESKHAGGDGCRDFATTANPKFKNSSFADTALKRSSPLIDRGNPKKPKEAKDIDGDKRALEGDCHANHPKSRRDIGADEFKCPKKHHPHHGGHGGGNHHGHNHRPLAVGVGRRDG